MIISVVIPTYNRANYLKQALESVRKQTCPPHELIVVDDGSTDDTPELVRAFPDCVMIRQSNEGLASAQNRGIAASTGDLIAFLDHDDLWPKNRLEIVANCFKLHPQIGYILGLEMMFLEPGCKPAPYANPDWLKTPQEASNTAVLVARRSLFKQVGLFNTEYALGADTEWLLRAKQMNIPMIRIPEILTHKRVHGANLSNQPAEQRKTVIARIARESVLRRRQKSNNR